MDLSKPNDRLGTSRGQYGTRGIGSHHREVPAITPQSSPPLSFTSNWSTTLPIIMIPSPYPPPHPHRGCTHHLATRIIPQAEPTQRCGMSVAFTSHTSASPFLPPRVARHAPSQFLRVFFKFLKYMYVRSYLEYRSGGGVVPLSIDLDLLFKIILTHYNVMQLARHATTNATEEFNSRRLG